MNETAATQYNVLVEGKLYVFEIKSILTGTSRDAYEYLCALRDSTGTNNIKQTVVGISDYAHIKVADFSGKIALPLPIDHLVVGREFLRWAFSEDSNTKVKGIDGWPLIDSENVTRYLGNPNKQQEKIVPHLLKIIIDFFSIDTLANQIYMTSILLSSQDDYQIINNALNYLSRRIKLIEYHNNLAISIPSGSLVPLENHLNELNQSLEGKRIKYFHEVPSSFIEPYGFILMPFKQSEFDQAIYENIIKPYIKNQYSIEIYDSRDQKFRSKVDNEIFTAIKNSSFIIAELTGRNPNVLYELGITHDMGLPAINITQDPLEDLPFDIKLVNADKYDPKITETGDKLNLINILNKHIPTYLSL